MNKSLEVRGLLQTTIAALFVVTGLTGCGSDISTAPSFTNVADESTGEVPLPPRDSKLPAPQSFSAAVLTGDNVQLSWKATSIEYTAVIILDGIEIARVSSRDGSYLDTIGKPAGDHVYRICFLQGDVVSLEARIGITLTNIGDNSDGGRGTDDLPELP
jgi:hypothetical protein